MGYILDNTLASEAGLENFKEKGYANAFRSAFASLCSQTFVKYMLVLIGLALPLTSFLNRLLYPLVHEYMPYVKAISTKYNFDCAEQICRMAIGNILFITFVNSAKMKWALSESTSEQDKKWAWGVFGCIVAYLGYEPLAKQIYKIFSKMLPKLKELYKQRDAAKALHETLPGRVLVSLCCLALLFILVTTKDTLEPKGFVLGGGIFAICSCVCACILALAAKDKTKKQKVRIAMLLSGVMNLVMTPTIQM